MGIAISPRHAIFEPIPSSDLSLEDKIDLFVARVDGWHLEVADRVINGWEVEKAPCIVAPHGGPITYLMYDETGQVVRGSRVLPVQLKNHIPDSGWAVLQIVINYFEIIGLFKFLVKGDSNRFIHGVFDVFPEFRDHEPNIAKILLKDLRGGLYHAGMRSGRIFLVHTRDFQPIYFDHERNQLKIDPHDLVRKLRAHLHEYEQLLKDPGQTVFRDNFQKAYDRRYVRKEQ